VNCQLSAARSFSVRPSPKYVLTDTLTDADSYIVKSLRIRELSLSHSLHREKMLTVRFSLALSALGSTVGHRGSPMLARRPRYRKRGTQHSLTNFLVEVIFYEPI
jgi:hypothetical protein